MSIPVQCSCGARLRVPDSMAGMVGRCPTCKAKVQVPTLTSAVQGPPPLPEVQSPDTASPEFAFASPATGQAAKRSSTADATQSGKPVRSPLQIAGSLVVIGGAGLIGQYAGANAILPFVACGIGWAIAHYCFDARRKAFEAAFATQLTEVLCMILGIVLAKTTTLMPQIDLLAVSIETVILAVGLLWLVVAPGIWPVALLLLLQTAGVCGKTVAILEIPIGSVGHRGVVVFLFLKVISICGLISGLLATEAAARSAGPPELPPTRSRNRRQRSDGATIVILVIAMLLGIALAVAGIVVAPDAVRAPVAAKSAAKKPTASPPSRKHTAVASPTKRNPPPATAASPTPPAPLPERRLPLVAPQPAASAERPKAAPVEAAPLDPEPQPVERLATVAPGEKANGLIELPRMGPAFGDAFKEAPEGKGALVGFEVTQRNAFGGELIESVRPIFQIDGEQKSGERYGGNTGAPRQVLAREGYAVGRVEGRAGLMVNGFKITFMRLNDGALDAADSYESPWIGFDQGGSVFSLDSNGKIIRGIYGSARKDWLSGFGFLVGP